MKKEYLQIKWLSFAGIGLFFIMLMVGLFLNTTQTVKAFKDKGSKNSKEITAVTAAEQAEINKKILEDWGSPTGLTSLADDFKASAFGRKGDKWVYLTKDIRANVTSTSSIFDRDAVGHIRILLNGYSISGTFAMNVTPESGSNYKLSIFDKIPNQTAGGAYAYNPNPEKYYTFNTQTGRYSNYSTTKPASGTDVTNMPTFKQDSYIKVTGSAMSPNLQSPKTADIGFLTKQNGVVNVYGVHFVSIATVGSVFYTEINGIFNLYQCDVIANISSNGALSTNTNTAIAPNANAVANVVACKIYGNMLSREFGIKPFESELPAKAYDIVIKIGQLNLYKSNIGALTSKYDYNTYNRDKVTSAIYLKDVDFGTKLNITQSNAAYFFNTINNINGTIELVYHNTVSYEGNSPNLNFIVHGSDTDETPPSGKNYLRLEKGSVINRAIVSGTGDISSGATVNQVLHDGKHGKLVDRRPNKVISRGDTTGTTSKVDILDGATVNTLDIRETVLNANYKGFLDYLLEYGLVILIVIVIIGAAIGGGRTVYVKVKNK